MRQNADWNTWRENWKEVTADDGGGISNIWSSCKFLVARFFKGKAGTRLDTTRWSAHGVLTSHNWVSQSSWWGPSSKERKPHQRRILFDPSSGRSAVFFGLAQQHNAAMVIFWRCAIHGFVDMHMICDFKTFWKDYWRYDIWGPKTFWKFHNSQCPSVTGILLFGEVPMFPPTAFSCWPRRFQHTRAKHLHVKNKTNQRTRMQSHKTFVRCETSYFNSIVRSSPVTVPV